MADQNLRGTVGDERVNRRQVGEKGKQANWFESVVAGAAMLVVGIVGVVAVFDWYFFSPHRVERSATIARLREDFTIRSEEQSSRARSLIVPMRSAANSINSR